VIDRDHVRSLSDALALEIPAADLDGLAVELAAQLGRIRSLDRLDLDDTPTGTFFDVRWER
jgi:hypothetical protein